MSANSELLCRKRSSLRRNRHTDRGSQYTADDYLALLKAHGIHVSMSNKGDPYDNAMMERFTTRQMTRTAVFEFIEVFYNRRGCIRASVMPVRSAAPHE